MLPETIDLLRVHGWIKDERINNEAISVALMKILVEHPVTTEAEIQQFGQTIGAMRLSVLGESDVEGVDEDLNDKVRELAPSSPKGRVQNALENGYMLCSAAVMRPDENGDLTVKERVKFVTSDPDLAEKYFHIPLVKRAVSAAANVNLGLDLAGSRIPLLASRRKLLVTKAQLEISNVLPVDET